MTSLAHQDSNQSPSKWYIIRTEPQADSAAASELRSAGFDIFSPLVKSQKANKVNNYAPLFPGYIFLKWDMEGAGKPSLQRAPHVSGWVNFEGVSPAVPDEVVSELASRIESINNSGGLWRRFKAGDRVRIVSGILEGLGEVIESTNSPQSKVRVLMDFMGRLIPAQVPWSSLQPLENYADEQLRPPRRTRGRGRPIRNPKPASVGAS